MKKLITLASLCALMFVTAQTANAQVQEPIWSCALDFDVEGGGVKLFIGNFKLEGTGEISCMDVKGNVEVLPVKITMGASPISLSAGIGYMRLKGVATGIGYAGQPSALLGDYVVADIKGSLGVGLGANLSLHGAKNSITLNAAVQTVKGLGLSVGLDTLSIEPLYTNE